MAEKVISILLIEDEQAHAEALMRCFSMLPEYRLTTVSTIREYHEKIVAQVPDIVIADMNLADGKAMEILVSPPESIPYPIMVLTSYGDEKVAVDSIKSGALEYLAKSPETFRNMRFIVDRVLREWNYIIDRKKAQEALHEKDSQYRRIVETANEGIFIIDKEQRFIYVNQQILDLIKCSPDEILDHPASAIIAPEELSDHESQIDNRRKGIHGRYERKLQRKDGTPLWALVSASPIMDADGGFSGSFGMVTDITDRKLAEDRLRQTVSLLQATLESTADGILVVDKSGKISGFNRQFEKMWKIPGSVLNRQDDHEALEYVYSQLKEPAQFVRKVEELYSKPEEISFDMLDFIDGRIFERFSQPQLLDGKPVGRVWSFRDVTARKRYEEELQKSREELRKLTDHIIMVREEEKKAIARDIHDDIGQKLAVLKWDFSWLASKLRPTKTTEKKLQEMNEMVKETIESIHRIMKELHPPELDELGFLDSIEWQTREILTRTGLNIQTDIDCEPFQLPANIELSIFRVIQEALTNIIRHSGATMVNLSIKTVNNKLWICIRDNGTGITRKALENAESYGLAGMKERISSCNGIIFIKGNPKKGTLIDITIPLPMHKQHLSAS